MYKLYKTRDLSLLMEKNLFPFLTRKICNYDSGWSDINSLRCVDMGLNRLIKDPITKCKKIKIANKRVCSVHCRAIPIYRYLQKRLEKHDRGVDVFIHFKSKILANFFKSNYYWRIKSGKMGRSRTCCGGKGFVLTMGEEKKRRIKRNYYHYRDWPDYVPPRTSDIQ